MSTEQWRVLEGFWRAMFFQAWREGNYAMANAAAVTWVEVQKRLNCLEASWL